MGSSRIRAYTYLILASFIWGVAAVVIKLTLKGIEPIPFLTYRFGIAAVVGTFFVVKNKKTLARLFKDTKTLLFVFLYSVLSTSMALGFLFWGLGKTTVLSLSLLDLTAPIVVAVLGVLFLREHFTSREKIGSVLAVGGSLLIILGPGVLEHADGALFGNFLIFMYVFTDALSSVFLKKLLKDRFPVLFLINISFIIGFLTVIPVFLFKYSPASMVQIVTTLPLPYQLGVLFMALISGSLAYYLRALGQKTIEIGEAGFFGYLISVFSIPLAILILNEKFNLLFIVGAVIIVVGIVIAETKKRRIQYA